jgi:translin
MDLTPVSKVVRERFDTRVAARERALPAARRSIRASANAIRAIHRGEFDTAHKLMDDSRAALDEGRDALADHPQVLFAGFVEDAEKEYAEARLTELLVLGEDIPGPDALGVGIGPYLNGMAESIGEGRRAILDLLRRGEVAEGERILATMDDLYGLLVTMDYPDAVTGNLRRSTDIARSLVEKTRGDLTIAIVQEQLRSSLDRHAREVLGDGDA